LPLLLLHLSNLPGVPTYLLSPSTNPKQTQKFFFSPLGTNLPNFLALFFLGFRILFSSLFCKKILQLLDFFCFKQFVLHFFSCYIFFSPPQLLVFSFASDLFFSILIFFKKILLWNFFLIFGFSFGSVVYCLQFYVHLEPESPLDERQIMEDRLSTCTGNMP
jgi:hypothetical protein